MTSEKSLAGSRLLTVAFALTAEIPIAISASIACLLFATISLVPAAFAQLAPSGQHYAGRPSDTGYGGTSVDATGALPTSIPLDLPAVRGNLPIPLQITYGASGVGAAGLGWDLPLSYIESISTFAHRRPVFSPGSLPTLRERTYLSLLGQRTELVPDGSGWVARYGTLELRVKKSGSSWLAYDGVGRTYTFIRPAALGSTNLWLLKSVSGTGGSTVQLSYLIATWPLDGGTGVAIDLVRIDYNTSPTAGCAKNEITLTYGNGSITPLAMSILGSKILVRKNTLTLVDVDSRATCGAPFQRLRRYQFQYEPDTDTLLPRLSSVRMFGRQGTSEENTSLPIATYRYGSATHGGALHYEHTQTIGLPTGVSYDQISGTALDSSVNAPVSGDRYAMWQTLTDVNGDGRPDLIFKKNNKLWVAYNRPASNGATTLGVGLQAIAELSDSTLSGGAVSTQTSTQRRFAYAPANSNTTNVWREAIDVNGDGRVDIIDAAEQADHWVVYLNTPGGPSGIKWERRSFLVTSLREALVSSGHVITGPYVPLSRRSTGIDLKIWQCWRWDGTAWKWYPQGFSNHLCEGTGQAILAKGSERTFVEWDLTDVNGDGYPDFVFDSSPVDFQPIPPSFKPQAGEPHIVGGAVWKPFAPASTNEVRVSFNVAGVRFDTDHDVFSRSVNIFAPASESGIAEWRCPVYSLGGQCDESIQTEDVGLVDVNGDGLADRVVGTKAYLGAYSGTAQTFSHVYIKLPGPLATQRNNHNTQCSGGALKSTAEQTQGLRDLNGDGIPDYFSGPSQSVPSDTNHVWIGTGTGFRNPIPIQGNFVFSHETESCDGKTSNTDGGLFDLDGDGRPDTIGLSGNTFLIFQLTGGQDGPGAPDAGRLIEVDNGYGAKTAISHVSAKNFTDNPVPFPEIVVSSVATTGSFNLGGTLAETRFAYGNANLVFDSALDRFSFPGYGRVVQLHLLKASVASSPSGAKLSGIATIIDQWPLTPYVPGMTTQERWLRMQRVGHTRDVLTVRSVTDSNPWSLLNVDSNNPHVIRAVNFDWGAKMYQVPSQPSENVFDCMEMVQPLDYASSFLDNLGNSNFLDTCRTHGFAFVKSRSSWYGGSPPPSADNIQTLTQTLAVDDFGQPLTIEYDNDVFRGDDDICERNTFAVPNGTFPRVLDALASRQFYTCGKNPHHNITVASEAWQYDNLPPGSVATGLVTSHSVDRRATDTGALLNTVHVFDATYDNAGNLKTMRTQRGSATRTFTFSYDPFGLVPTHIRLDASGIAPIELASNYDPLSLEDLDSGVVGQTRYGMDFDGFGRPIRSTVTTPGGSLGVLTTTSYFGFDNSDPAGRRITSTRFSDPIAPANVSSTSGRTATMYLDELGRERRIEEGLGSDYGNGVLVLDSRVYDDAGRIAFEADPYVKGQDPAKAYGTTYYFGDSGDLRCSIRGQGEQAFSMVSDAATERFPTCFQRSFANHLETLDVSDAASLEPGSQQFQVVNRVIATAIGRVLERSTVRGGTRLEDSTLAYDPLGQTTSFTRFLNPVAQTGPVQWSLKLDSMGQTLQLIQPATAARYYSYSDWGEPVETRWLDGAVVRRLLRKYDSLGRLTEIEESNNGVTDPETVSTYTYDTAVNVSPLITPTFVSGELASAKSPTDQVTFSYDAFGRVNALVFTDSNGGLYIERAVHNADGRLTTLEFNLPDHSYDNEVVKYGYDSAGRLRQIKYTDSSRGIDIYKAEAIDSLGRVRKALVGNNATYHASYASAGRQLIKEEAVQSPLGSIRVVFGPFDPVGRELDRTEFRNGAATGMRTQLAYDALGRLWRSLQTQGPTAISDWHFSYDPLGNLRALQNGGASATLSYDTNDRDRVCRIGYGTGGLGGTACNVSYDAVGDTISEPTRTSTRILRYFDSGKVRRIIQGGAQAAFHYDAFDNVGELSLTGPGASNIRNVWRYGSLIERRYEVRNGAKTSLISRRIPGPGGTVLASRLGTNWDWVFQFGEQRGNRFFVNQDGAFVQDVDYQPFGEATSTGASVGGADYTSYQWNGGDALARFDLSQLGARIYDPVIGRFLSRDPLTAMQTAASSNPYAFAMNDPVNGSDSTGLQPCIGDECHPDVPLVPLGQLFGAIGSLFAGTGSTVADVGSSIPSPIGPILGPSFNLAVFPLALSASVFGAYSNPAIRKAMYDEAMYQAEQARICGRDPSSPFCDSSDTRSPSLAQKFAAGYFNFMGGWAVGIPKYYVKTYVSRVGMQNARNGVEYFAARDRYMAARVNIAMSRINEETARYFNAAMSLSGSLISFGAPGAAGIDDGTGSQLAPNARPNGIGAGGGYTYGYGYNQGVAAAEAGQELVLGKFPSNVDYVANNPGTMTLDVPKGWTPNYNAGFIRGFLDTGGSIRLIPGEFSGTYEIEIMQILTIPGS